MYTTGRCARAASDSEKIGKKLKKMEKTEINPAIDLISVPMGPKIV